MPKLTLRQKVKIVDLLATYHTPTEVRKIMEEEDKIKPSLPHIIRYNASKGAGKKLSKELKKRFWETRDKYLDRVSDVPIANKRKRLEYLQRALDRAEKAGSAMDVDHLVSVLKAAAQDMGDYWTSKRQHEVRGSAAPVLVVNAGLTAPQESE